MRELPMFELLYPDVQLTSPSERFVLRCDSEGIAVITDTDRDQVVWRAGATGQLLLGHGCEVVVEGGEDDETVWRSGFAAPGAQYLTLTDAGELELLDRTHVRLGNIRTGLTHPVPLGDAAPAAAITRDTYLLKEGKIRRTVAREQDGWLRVCEYGKSGGMSYALTRPLVDWFEQEDTVLTWRRHLAGGSKSKSLMLCLVDSAGTVLWHEGTQRPHGPVPTGEPYAYGGPALEAGGRLRNQSLTSPAGTHTLAHQGNGDLTLYCHTERRAVWSTGTGWVDGGWAELSEDGVLSVRNTHGVPVWSSGPSGSGARRLVVGDDGRAELRDVDGRSVWSTGTHTACHGPTADAPRGAVLRRGQTLGRHSLTSPDGSTVLGHWDERRLVLFGADQTWLWYAHLGEAAEPGLRLAEDGMLRVLGDERPPLGGPADELRVEEGGVILCRADGTIVWRDGEPVAEPAAATNPPARGGIVKSLPDTDETLLIRTDFSDATAWQALLQTVTTPNQDGFLANVRPVDELAYRDLTTEQILSAAGELDTDLLIVADKTSLTAPEMPLLALLLIDENDECREGEARQEHGQLRVIATELWSVENNISLANMDWEDFENATDNGVFRGF